MPVVTSLNQKQIIEKLYRTFKLSGYELHH